MRVATAIINKPGILTPTPCQTSSAPTPGSSVVILHRPPKSFSPQTKKGTQVFPRPRSGMPRRKPRVTHRRHAIQIKINQGEARSVHHRQWLPGRPPSGLQRPARVCVWARLCQGRRGNTQEGGGRASARGILQEGEESLRTCWDAASGEEDGKVFKMEKRSSKGNFQRECTADFVIRQGEMCKIVYSTFL